MEKSIPIATALLPMRDIYTAQGDPWPTIRDERQSHDFDYKIIMIYSSNLMAKKYKAVLMSTSQDSTINRRRSGLAAILGSI